VLAVADRLNYGIMMFPRSAAETRRVAERAEALGFSWLGIADSPTVYQESYLHQLEALRATCRLSVGPVVTHVTLRHPLVVGNLLATLNEIGDGRTVGVLATGNSGARGIGLPPATVKQVAEAVDAIRGYWAGAGGRFAESRIPATGLTRKGCPLFIAADGQRMAALAGEQGDGMFYGGTMEPVVLERRIAAGRKRPDQKLWLGPAVSLATTVGSVLDEMGTLVVAMANRAFRRDLFERGIPESLHADIHAMWKRYDYAYHADTTRPQNVEVVTPALAEFLVEHFVVWGDAPRWRAKLGLLRSHGCDGVMFILGQGDVEQTVDLIAARLQELGELARTPA
jgi:alkanesulfonate monooxygenase SsuD/methylene tetrahydromethanopterin reductase-like flavin-dependent oxidoreductase (luciferase family)